jgi:hypothetical protein
MRYEYTPLLRGIRASISVIRADPYTLAAFMPVKLAQYDVMLGFAGYLQTFVPPASNR